MLRLKYFYHRSCLGCRRIARMLPPWEDVEMVDVETKDGEEQAILYGIQAIPTVVAIIDDFENIATFCKLYQEE